MSMVEGLLRLAVGQGGDEVVLREGAPPAIRVRGVSKRLSMPITERALVVDALHEVIGAKADVPEGDDRVVLGDATVRVRWRIGDRAEATFTRSSKQTTPSVEAAAPVRAIETPPAHVHVEAAPSLAALLHRAVERRASDLVIVEGRPVAAKIDGEMIGWEVTLVEGELAAAIAPYLDTTRARTFEETGSVDFAIAMPRDGSAGASKEPLRFRASAFRTLAGLGAVIRPIADRPPTIASLRLPESIARFAELRDGLVLFTGAAGSGKSTSLVALVEHLARTRARHVVTLEDPIEYVFPNDRAVVHQREIGTHVRSFADGLRAALREAPDVILLGEMRDAETISAAVTAAETGHLVLSTLHAGTAAGAIDRIVDVFPEFQQRQVRHQLADVLRVVCTQRLVPARSGGRVPALEILPVNAAVANLVREGKAFQIPQVIQTGRDAGMVPMARALADWVKHGVVEREVAIEHATDPSQLLAMLR